MTHVKLDSRSLPPEFMQATAAWSKKAQAALAELSQKTCRGGEFTDWYNWPDEAGFALQKRCHDWVAQLKVPYDLIVVLGIGGSYAGCRAIDEALRHSYQNLMPGRGSPTSYVPIVYAGHNLSESQLIELLDLLPAREPIVNVISKSGTTTEPSVAFRLLRAFMEQRFGRQEASERIVVTSDPDSGVLRSLASELGYASFEIPPGVGGRYSLLTAVGLVPLTLAGHDCEALMEGAHALFSSLDGGGLVDGKLHPTLELAAVRRAAWDFGKRLDVFAYGEPKLAAFVEWWKQLFGESEGKEERGLFPVGMAYSTDLHSLGQYLQEGFPSMLETFLLIDEAGEGLQVERRLRVPHAAGGADGLAYLEGRYLGEINQAAMDAARWAHSERGVPCVALRLPRLDSFHLGYLVAFFEVSCAISASLLGVNAFDQPGVEAYKKNLFGIMGKPGFEELTSAWQRSQHEGSRPR